MLEPSPSASKILAFNMGSTFYSKSTAQISPHYTRSRGGGGIERWTLCLLSQRGTNHRIWLDRYWASFAKTSKRLHCLQVPSLWNQLFSALKCAIKWETLCWLPLMIRFWLGFEKEPPWGSSVIFMLFSSRTLQR